MDRTIVDVERATCHFKARKVLLERCRQRGTTGLGRGSTTVSFICQLNARHPILETYPLCRRLETSNCSARYQQLKIKDYNSMTRIPCTTGQKRAFRSLTERNAFK